MVVSLQAKFDTIIMHAVAFAQEYPDYHCVICGLDVPLGDGQIHDPQCIAQSAWPINTEGLACGANSNDCFHKIMSSGLCS